MVVNFAAVDIHEKLNCTVLITYWVLIFSANLAILSLLKNIQGLYTMPIFQYFVKFCTTRGRIFLTVTGCCVRLYGLWGFGEVSRV